MIRKSLLVSIVGISLLAAGPVWSKGFKYSFADFLYNGVDGGDEFLDSDSLSAKGSFAVHNFVHLLAGIERGTVDDFPGDSPDITEFTLGIGGNYDFGKKVSTYLDATFYDRKINGNKTSIDQGGYRGEAGLRYQVNKPFEFDLYYLYDAGDVDDNFFGARLLINITKKVKLHLGYQAGEDNEPQRLSGGIRLNF